MKKYISFILIVFLLTSCSKDKGNYNYTDLNDITIADLKESYTFILDEFVDISPTITQTVSTGELEYTWEIDNKTISTEKHLKLILPSDYPAGIKQGRFSVYDKSTGLFAYHTFMITLTSPFNFGYYFLTENASRETVLSYYASSNVVDGMYGPGEIKHTKTVDGLSLGKEPIFINGFFDIIASTMTYSWTIYLGTKDNKYPCIETNSTNFKVTSHINADNFIEKNLYNFAPDAMFISTEEHITTFVSEGSPIDYSEGYLYRPASYNKTYSWSNFIMHAAWEPLYTAFDEISNKFYVLTNDSDPYALDKVINIANSPDLTGMSILGANTNEYSTEQFVVAANETEFNFIKFIITGGEEALESIDVINTDIFTENSKAVLITEDWYISSNNVVYIASTLMPDLSVFATLPLECGEITAIGPSSKSSTIVLATYNESSTEEYKGSIIFIDKYTAEITVFENVIHKCVGLLGANANNLWEVEGDDK